MIAASLASLILASPLAAALALTACVSEGDTTSNASLSSGLGAEDCTESASWVSCPHHTTLINLRTVHWQVPAGTPPEGGWPTVVMFQGSLATALLSWQAADWFPAGAYHQTLVIKRLLDHGFAVITPEARLAGLTFWDTNVPGLANHWELAGDHRLMLAIFDAIDDGAFGELRGTRLYATGISSGGYMTSRMTVSYPERFAAIGVMAGSYATCLGPFCDIPALDPDHAPTLILHGEADFTVPFSTAERYRDRLAEAGIEHAVVTNPTAGHEWISAAPDAILDWFQAHP